MEYWHLMKNPTGETYRHFIKVLCDHSDKFYFVTMKEFDYNHEVLEKFQSHVIETYKTNQWAQTITRGPAVTVYVIKANQDTCQLLQQLSNSLYDWVAPLPEDLTFIKNNIEWFTCTTHEEMGGFLLSSESEKELLGQIQGFEVEKDEEE
ncbi:hypothetical protein HOO54_12225 [Bacillus sp. WMMC1349]|uniref:hypothetical protein n=1 Tax=Bacillus sp. WMMC1349 TaxID=2736254 RepID=UPI001551DE22|nr:hypothetical protein [Bacillus sp. WMMC1349]NPC92974.1 hypothetical protein [Bacillus sp. WMMC1349]